MLDVELVPELLRTLSLAKNLVSLAIGGAVARSFPSRTDITFEDLVTLADSLPRLVSLFIPWTQDVHEPSTETESLDSSTSSQLTIHNRTVEFLGYPCFDVDLYTEEAFMTLEYYFPSLQTLYVFSPHAGSWISAATRPGFVESVLVEYPEVMDI
jgi:hypothetical protein